MQKAFKENSKLRVEDLLEDSELPGPSKDV